MEIFYIYQVPSSTVFFFVSYRHIHVPFIAYCSRLFVAVFRIVYILLNMTLFVIGPQSCISPPSFMFVSAAVSEIGELNWNKKEEKNSEIGYFHLSWAYKLPIF